MSEPLGPPLQIAEFYVAHIDGVIRSFGQRPAGYVPPPVPYPPGYTPPPAPTQVMVNEPTYLAVAAAPESFYCADDDVAPREANSITLSTTAIAADGLEEAVIAGIPAGSRLRVQGAVTLPWTAVDDGEVVLTCGEPGRLQVSIECPPPWLAWEGSIDAT